MFFRKNFENAGDFTDSSENIPIILHYPGKFPDFPQFVVGKFKYKYNTVNLIMANVVAKTGAT